MKGLVLPLVYPRQLAALTSLRFFAAYWVVLHHLDDGLRPNIDAYTGLLRKGYLAVDVFFILSGFILSHVYWADGVSGRLDYWNFLSKRLARIYPMHITTMALMGLLVGIGAVTGLPVDATAHADAVAANLLLIHAWGTTTGLSWNAVSWSISAEWFAYLLFPVMLAVALRFRARPLALVGLAIGWLLVQGFLVRKIGGVGLFHLKDNYAILRIAPEFCLGCALYGLGRSFALGCPNHVIGHGRGGDSHRRWRPSGGAGRHPGLVRRYARFPAGRGVTQRQPALAGLATARLSR